MKELVITTDEGSKGRSFRAVLLSYATSKHLWTGGATDNMRPIYATIACSAAESLPFVRNLQAGRKAHVRDADARGKDTTIFECLKSADYSWAAQAHPEGVVWTCYLQSLYRIDAGMVDPEGVKFAIVAADQPDPDAALVNWLAGRFERPSDEMVSVVRWAPLFAAYLNSRSRCPLIPEPRFYALMLASMLAASHACMGNREAYSRLPEWGRSGINYHEYQCSGIVCNVTHERLEPLLAECVRVYERG